MKPRIAIALQTKNIYHLAKLVKKAEKKADILELRLDYLSSLHGIENLLKKIHIPCITTIRPTWEGGHYSGSEKKRIQKLQELIPLTNFVDIELDSKHVPEISHSCNEAGTKLIISKHFFKSTPSLNVLNKILNKQISFGANVCKIITFANTIQDNITMLNFVRHASKKTNLVSFAMGELGVISRLLSPLHGAYFTFGCLDYGKETAKGQLSIDEMLQFYKSLR